MEHDGAMAQALAEITRQIAGAMVLIVTTMLTGGVGVLIVAANSYFARKKAIILEAKMDLNNEWTLETKKGIKDVKSDVLQAKDTAAEAKDDASKAKAQATLVDLASRKSTGEVLKKVNEGIQQVKEGNDILKETREAINGRTTELINAARAEGVLEGSKIHDGMSARIGKLEGGHEVLVQGQTLLIKHMDRLMEEVHEISKDVKAQSKHD